MSDCEPWIAESLARVYPLPLVTADWDDVLERARVRRRFRTGPIAPTRVPRKLMLAFALAAAGVAVLLSGIPFSSSPAVLERAAAALEPGGRILHIVDRWGDGGIGTVYGESWKLPDGSLDHVIFRSASGAVGADCIISATQTRCWSRKRNVVDVYRHRPPDPGYRRNGVTYGSDWPGSLQRGLASGNARLLGPKTFDGKAVYAILLAVQVGPDPSMRFVNGLSDTLYVDRQTYLPVAEYMPTDMSTRYFDTFEFLPDTAKNRKAVELSAPADAKVVVHPVGVYPPEGK